jgi:hypothetical protein
MIEQINRRKSTVKVAVVGAHTFWISGPLANKRFGIRYIYIYIYRKFKSSITRIFNLKYDKKG